MILPMRRNRSVQRALETLRSSLTQDPAALRRYALSLVCELADADVALWFELGLVDGDPVPVRWGGQGTNPDILREQARALPYPHGDPRLPDPRHARRFVPLRSVIKDVERDFYDSRLYEAVWRASKIEDQIRMVVHHEGHFVAFIGAYRRAHEPLFGRSSVERLQLVSDGLADALITAKRVELAAYPQEACDLLLTPEGRVEYASKSSRTLIGKPDFRDALTLWARAANAKSGPLGEPPDVPRILAGHHVRWSRLEGASNTRFLVQLERVGPVRIHPAFKLSRTQRTIARLACAGASAPEIAQMLGCSAETVRTHLRQTYQLLEVSSRAELARTLVDLPEERRYLPRAGLENDVS